MKLLELRDVTQHTHDGLREVVVLDNVSLELYAGETLGVLAGRKAGKTTLLRIMAGLDVPDRGKVFLRGRDMAACSPDERARNRRRGGIGMMSGDWRPSASNGVIEHVAMPLFSHGLGPKSAETLAWSALEQVDCTRLGRLSTSALSLRDRVRVDLARAIVREPSVLLVDEPAVLPQLGDAQELFALVHSLAKTLHLSLVIASEEIAAVRGAQRIVQLDNGRLYSTDSRRKVVNLAERRGTGDRGGLSSTS